MEETEMEKRKQKEEHNYKRNKGVMEQWKKR